MNPLIYPSGLRPADHTVSTPSQRTSPRHRPHVATVDGVSSDTAEWLLEINDLTVGGSNGPASDIIRQSQALAAGVRTAATAYLASVLCEGPACDDACTLADIDGGSAACRLAQAMAFPDGGVAPYDGSAADFLQAVKAAAPAVFHCRRHAHPTGECWFADDATDACGDVLAVAHRVAA